MANDLVGTGPRLQLRIPNNPEASQLITKRFAKWVKAIGLADKLRVMHESRVRDGECFAVFSNNPQLDRSVGVQLDLRPVESDQVTSAGPILNPLEVDGILHDQFGNVTEYKLLNHHPGSNIAVPWEFMTVPAARVVHWFRPSRPGQARGIPELTPALPLCAQLRRYTLATLTAAETAAMLAGIMKTNMPAGDGSAISVDAMDEIELVRGALLTLPAGWDTTQFKPEQPTGTFKEFKNEILNEMARCVNVPFNVMAGNSSGYNYSSGRLDHLVYYRVVWIERGRMEQRVLDRLFAAWLYEAALLPGFLPVGLPPVVDWESTWQWDGVESIDPQKDAQATQLEMSLGLTTLAEEAAARGRDWREVLNQLAIEQAEAKRLGLQFGTVTTIPVGPDQATTTLSPPEPATTSDTANNDAGTTQVTPPTATADVQATALNGAQVTSLVGVIDKLTAKTYTGPATKALIQGAFPGFGEALIDTLITELQNYQPPPQPDATATSTGAPNAAA